MKTQAINPIFTNLIPGTSLNYEDITIDSVANPDNKIGIVKGIGYSLFHSISAFCNAGFDLMGRNSGQYSSLGLFYNNPVIVFTISTLIILGGIGFGVMACVIAKKRFRHFDLSSKLKYVNIEV